MSQFLIQLIAQVWWCNGATQTWGTQKHACDSNTEQALPLFDITLYEVWLKSGIGYCADYARCLRKKYGVVDY